MTSTPSHHREVKTTALLFTGLGSIIGSGWLFGAWRAAGLAGPGAIWAWVLGAAIVMTVALTYSELGAMFPERGGMVRYGHYSHGALVGFIAGWSNWIVIISVVPVEAEASVQYMASWSYDWAHGLYVHAANGQGELTTTGLAIAAVLVLIYFLLNFWSVKLFARSNSAITVIKLIIPAVTGLALISSGFHASNFHVALRGDSHALDFAAILNAVATAGIVFSFNGFQSPVNMAGEAHNPGRSVPIAVLGSILLATIVYLLLQVAYIGSVPPDLLAKAGWQGIDFRSPFAELALMVNLNWLAIMLYADAFVSPSGTGITYTATSARMIYGMQRNGTLPAIFGRLHPDYGVPRAAMWFDLVVAYVFLFKYRGWGTLAAVISVATIVSYLTGPVSVVTLRRTAPHLKRPLRVPAIRLISGLAFIFATELFYWAKWPLTGQIMLLIVIALPVYIYYQARSGWQNFRMQLHGAWWLIVYLPVIALVSWAGSSKFGGQDFIKWGWDLLVVAAVGLVFFLWGARSGWTTPEIAQMRSED
ncbi:MAG TPA: APC family permease [Steroidobacteraceae bacterium]|jgi:amino acid transporter|nr:APC family permease [Steroidobacteraceae bacterium]